MTAAAVVVAGVACKQSPNSQVSGLNGAIRKQSPEFRLYSCLPEFEKVPENEGHQFCLIRRSLSGDGPNGPFKDANIEWFLSILKKTVPTSDSDLYAKTKVQLAESSVLPVAGILGEFVFSSGNSGQYIMFEGKTDRWVVIGNVQNPKGGMAACGIRTDWNYQACNVRSVKEISKARADLKSNHPDKYKTMAVQSIELTKN